MSEGVGFGGKRQLVLVGLVKNLGPQTGGQENIFKGGLGTFPPF